MRRPQQAEEAARGRVRAHAHATLLLLFPPDTPRGAETKGLAFPAGGMWTGSGIWWHPDRGREHHRFPNWFSDSKL
jgi:hypothetical protein